MDKKVLNEIDRLEGIAQACRWARPLVPMTGAIEDCNEARNITAAIEELKAEVQYGRERLEEANDNMIDAAEDRRTAEIRLYIDALVDLCVEEGDLYGAQRDLDKLMASLSARLER